MAFHRVEQPARCLSGTSDRRAPAHSGAASWARAKPVRRSARLRLRASTVGCGTRARSERPGGGLRTGHSPVMSACRPGGGRRPQLRDMIAGAWRRRPASRRDNRASAICRPARGGCSLRLRSWNASRDRLQASNAALSPGSSSIGRIRGSNAFDHAALDREEEAEGLILLEPDPLIGPGEAPVHGEAVGRPVGLDHPAQRRDAVLGRVRGAADPQVPARRRAEQALDMEGERPFAEQGDRPAAADRRPRRA